MKNFFLWLLKENPKNAFALSLFGLGVGLGYIGLMGWAIAIDLPILFLSLFFGPLFVIPVALYLNERKK